MYNVTDTYKTLIKQPTRYVGISGAVKLRSGELVTFTDKNIESGSLSITDRLNRRGDFRPGGVYSSGLSIGFTGLFAKTNDLDGAVIRLNYLLYPNSEMKLSEAEIVPLGRFYVDGSTIKRTRSTVRLKADDGLMLFDVPATERSGTLYELVNGACAAAGVSFGMTQAEFEALPNATMSAAVNTSRVQTERDLLMYVGMLTGSFARIDRSALALEFCPLTCDIDTSTKMIIPVREIAGNIRFSTDFSDDTTRIAKLFMRRNGTALYSSLGVTAGGSEKLATLELDENPLMSGLSDSDVTAALDSLISQLYHCLNRVFDVDFTGDPALEVGDYVRLRGGEIDTDRGYATGMITSQTWTYHGSHRIKCSLPSSLVYSGEESAVMLLADDSGEATATEPAERVQPKSQLEKRLDAVEAIAGGDGKLHDVYGSSSVGELVGNTSSWIGLYIRDNNGNNSFKIVNHSAAIEFSSSHGRLELNSAGNEIELSGSAGKLLINLTHQSAGRLTFTPKSGYGDSLQITAGTGEAEISIGNCTLSLRADGLYYNNHKVLLESSG